MSLRVVLYRAEHQAAALAFNARMRAADGLLFPLPEMAPESNPCFAAGQLEFRHYVVVDDAGEVRGGYFIRSQPFWIRGRVHSVGHYTAPLSEGTVAKRYMPVGGMMLAHALAEQPLLFAMGMGGMDRPLPRMLQAMGWAVLETPFYFLVLNARRFLRNVGPLRSSAARRLAADALAFSGLGSAALKVAQAMHRRGPLAAQPLREFGAWTDEIWRATAPEYSFSAVRSADYLRFIYPPDVPSYYSVTLNAAGWVEMLDCQPHDRSYFGDMRVAALVDGVGPAAVVRSLVDCAVEAARAHNADIVISNQMHRDWGAALRRAGFWRGPSNYLLAISREIRKLLEPLDEAVPRIHFNRGDGDGRVNLIY